MVCWGPYCVPSYAPKGEYAEWYWNRVRSGKGPSYDFHVKNYGADYDYRRFGPMMRGEFFNPDDWADLFARSGAKYVVMTANYHDGFCLWPSPYSAGWNAKDTGPKRDVLGEVTAAVRNAGSKWESTIRCTNGIIRSGNQIAPAMSTSISCRRSPTS